MTSKKGWKFHAEKAGKRKWMVSLHAHWKVDSLQIRQENYSCEFTQLKNSMKLHHALIIDLLFLFLFWLKWRVLCWVSIYRRQKAERKGTGFRNCNMATPYEEKNVLTENVSLCHFIDSKRAKEALQNLDSLSSRDETRCCLVIVAPDLW